MLLRLLDNEEILEGRDEYFNPSCGLFRVKPMGIFHGGRGFQCHGGMLLAFDDASFDRKSKVATRYWSKLPVASVAAFSRVSNRENR